MFSFFLKNGLLVSHLWSKTMCSLSLSLKADQIYKEGSLSKINNVTVLQLEVEFMTAESETFLSNCS